MGGVLPGFAGCEYNIPCLEKKNAWLSQRLQRGVEPFAFSQKADVPREDMVGQKLSATYLAFRDYWQRQRSRRCAVVGSSVNLLGSGYGRQIDDYDLVIRMNSAPTKGYERDVGTRTSFNVVNTATSRLPDIGANNFTVIWGGRPQRSLKKQWQGNADEVRKLVLENREQPVLLLTRQFNRYVARKWFASGAGQDSSPSTGVRAIVLGLHLCDTVDLYGFGADKEGRWWHYYKRGTIYPRHEPDRQEILIRELVEHKIVRLYQGNAEPPDPKKARTEQ